MSLAALAHPSLVQRGGDPDLAWAEYRDAIEAAITGTERSMQTRIGPSEIGTECTRCLARKLAGQEQTRDAAWLPFVGTCVHAVLADIFERANGALGHTRYLVEHKVDVGEINGVTITGHADLYDIAVAEVTDWKIVGATTLTKAKGGPTQQYRVQAHLYGRGFTRAGLAVDTVRVAYLPRNAVSLRSAVIWHEPYDEQVAVAALARADALAKAVAAVGIDVLAPELDVHPDCYDCPRYDPAFTPPGHKPDPMGDLLGG